MNFWTIEGTYTPGDESGVLKFCTYYDFCRRFDREHIIFNDKKIWSEKYQTYEVIVNLGGGQGWVQTISWLNPNTVELRHYSDTGVKTKRHNLENNAIQEEPCITKYLKMLDDNVMRPIS